MKRGSVARRSLMILFAALPAVALLPGAAFAEEAVVPEGPRPPWLEPDVIKASLEIGLDEAQQPEFRRIVGQFITDRISMIQQEIRRGPPNLDRVIKSKTKRLEKAMDDEMKTVLTSEQWPKFENYKKVLQAHFRSI